eukprot:CAMPEP_0178437478 /NCGR_PEP_ID=MMETSP0689_2-20121128/35023_1 /TAXON_ID=160604 /ORGANISM="Amphidinium massartii, Strain CS-259" /LENGTH=59 /DNA_ID=CAMNT_0020059701 /DNA_START=267 /DNA_END=446 /DNA_ORIENTATION=+
MKPLAAKLLQSAPPPFDSLAALVLAHRLDATPQLEEEADARCRPMQQQVPAVVVASASL